MEKEAGALDEGGGTPNQSEGGGSSPANHRERLVTREKGRPGDQGHSFLAGVDEIRVLQAPIRIWSLEETGGQSAKKGEWCQKTQTLSPGQESRSRIGGAR